jgi:hypothetical protein
MKVLIILIITLSLVVGLPVYLFYKKGYIRSVQGDVINFKKRIWAVWATIVGYVVACFLLLFLTGFSILHVKIIASSTWLKFVFVIALVFLVLKAISSIIQAFKNRFDSLTLFYDRVEIINSGHNPEHLIIKYSDIESYRLELVEYERNGEDKFALKINELMINLSEINLNFIAQEIDLELKKKLDEFKSQHNTK